MLKNVSFISLLGCLNLCFLFENVNFMIKRSSENITYATQVII